MEADGLNKTNEAETEDAELNTGASADNSDRENSRLAANTESAVAKRPLPPRKIRLRHITLILSLIVSAVSLGILIYLLASGNDPSNRKVSCIGAFILPLIPYAGELIFRKRLSGFVLAFYLAFVFCASFLGNVMSLYGHVRGYDKIMHSIFGYVGCVGGLFLICVLEKDTKLKAATVCIVCFAVSMACGAIWEICEFTGDTFFGQASQGSWITLENGKKIISVNDSMHDLLCNLLGAAVFCAHYILHKLTGKNLLMKSMRDDFCGIKLAANTSSKKNK